MIRKRFPQQRRRRIAVWTAVAVTWATAIVARALGAPSAQPVDMIAVPEPPGPAPRAPVVPPSEMPVLPEDGLVILRFTPAPQAEPDVRRVVVTQSAPATSPAAPAPTTKRSGGS